MGTWGTALLSDDVACDVRDEYTALVKALVPDAEATRQVVSNWQKVVDSPEGLRNPDVTVFWVALAVTQSRLGRLEPDVARKAVEIIDAGADVATWQEESPRKGEQRRAALAKARAQITGPQPARRTFRLPTTKLRPGDVLAYPARNGPWLLMRVVNVVLGVPVLVLLDYASPQIPALEQIAGLADSVTEGGHFDGRVVPFQLRKAKNIDYARGGYVLVGNIGTRTGDEQYTEGVIERGFCDYLPSTRLFGDVLRKWHRPTTENS